MHVPARKMTSRDSIIFSISAFLLKQFQYRRSRSKISKSIVDVNAAIKILESINIWEKSDELKSDENMMKYWIESS